MVDGKEQDINIDLLSSKYSGIDISGDLNRQKYISQARSGESDNVLLFFSFDIVNSSIYKSNNYYGWSIVIDSILSNIRNYISNQVVLTEAEVWRILGDEVVFIIKIRNKEALFDYIGAIYKALLKYCDSIENGELLKEINDQNILVDVSNLKDVLSVQASAWIAAVDDKNNAQASQTNVDNVFEIIEGRNGIKFNEFIGIDIDAGFRISKYTRSKRLALSFELAYILSQNSAINNNLHIIKYCSLKGIWNNAVYPIIWYYDKSFHNGASFEESIPFDAKIKDKIYNELLGKKQFSSIMYDNANIALEKVCRDRRLNYKIKKIEERINAHTDSTKPLLADPKLELHLVAICYNQNKEILTVQRNENRFLPGKWEFGCAKANIATDLETVIKREYKQDFGIDIKVITDDKREDSQPIPIAVYSIEKRQEIHKGIIFLAEIINGEVTLNPNKHRDYKFLKEEDIQNINAAEYVNDARDTLEKAFVKINQIERNESST